MSTAQARSMVQPFIDDQDVERALDFLRDNATAIGAAKERAVKAAHMVKHVRAILMKKHNDMPVSAQEREATADSVYLAALSEEAVAAGEYEKMRALREAAALKIEVWRTMGANYRSMKI